MKTVGYAAFSDDAHMKPYHFERRDLRANDVAAVGVKAKLSSIKAITSLKLTCSGVLVSCSIIAC